MRLERSRSSGAVWLGWILWRALKLDELCGALLACKRETVAWSEVIALLVIGRLCEPSSELHVAERWYRTTALEDLLGVAVAQRQKAPVYSQAGTEDAPIFIAGIRTIFQCQRSVDTESSLIYALDSMTGGELKRARAKLGMTQKELGEALGVHWNSVARMERNEFPIIRTTELAVKYLLIMKSKKGEKKKERCWRSISIQRGSVWWIAFTTAAGKSGKAPNPRARHRPARFSRNGSAN